MRHSNAQVAPGRFVIRAEGNLHIGFWPVSANFLAKHGPAAAQGIVLAQTARVFRTSTQQATETLTPAARALAELARVSAERDR